MNNADALAYVKQYFYEIFGKRNLAALDTFLDKDYFDEDIGDPAVDHRENSRQYLSNLFRDNPGINVNVIDAIAHEDVITAYLEWFVEEDGRRRVIRKGVANFIIKHHKITRRHTFVYYQEE